MRCIAVDDEPLALRQLVSYIEKNPYLELVGTCGNSKSAMKLLQENEVDLLFIDINMPGVNGIEFVKGMDYRPLVVFTTAYSEYALEGLKLEAVDYLMKPFGQGEFDEAVDKASKRFISNHGAEVSAMDSDNAIFFKSSSKIVRVDATNILYVEGMSEYIKVHVSGDKNPVVVLLSMKKFEETLPKNRFMRIHKSYIINLTRIREVSKGRIELVGDVNLPIGDSYRDAFNAYLSNKFLGK